jgi:D-beta-D-heptose 7-phosphate kinase/D-beta-D-heptose 1-phosphate adenosyltransferase
VEYLSQARGLGDVLVVGLNSDASIRRIKGNGRPINRAADRATVLAALGAVDFVCLFRDDTPIRMIAALKPDILVKGADWRLEEIVGRDIVEQYGGRVKRIPLTEGRSTTAMIRRIKRAGAKRPLSRQ